MLRSQIERQGFALSQTSGASMRPLIWGGRHTVTVVPLKSEPNVGDLLMFAESLPNGENRRIIHRLIAIKNEGDERVYLTRGDNNIGCEIAHYSDIIGLVTEIHRTTGFRPWYIIPSKKFTVTDTSYLVYKRVWKATWQLRRLYYLLRGYTRGLISRLFR